MSDQTNNIDENTNNTSNTSKHILEIPQGITIDLINDKDVIILWNEISDKNAQNIKIFRMKGTQNKFEEIASVPPNESSYIDTNVELDETYSYRVSTYGKNFISGDSEVKSIQVKKNINENIQNTINSIDANSQNTPVTNQNKDSFWVNLISINLIIIGAILMIYLLIRRYIEKRQEKKLIKSLPKEIKMKLGKKDVNIPKQARKKFFHDRKNKIQEWLSSSD